ncbi:MAG: hypothetical protein ACSHYB_03165 [Roseibacillus sp.]
MTDFGQMDKIEEPELSVSDLEQLKVERGERRKKFKKRSKPPVRVYLGWFGLWILAVGIVLLVVSRLQEQFAGGEKNALTIAERLVGEEREFYRQEYPRIYSQFSGFIASRRASEMAEFTRDSHQLERKMGRHFKGQTARRPSLGLKDQPVFWNVAFEESPGFVEVVWDGKESGFFEGVFVKVDDEWLLDWEQYARYSSESWTLFHKRIGGQRSGVFRVYVEKVSEGDGTDFEPWMKVKISPPHADTRRRELEESESIQLEGKSGLRSDFVSLFADLSGRTEGFSKLWKRDPDGLRRATLELEWVADPVSGEERMVIKRLLAENWRVLNADAGQPASENDSKDLTNDE